MTRYIKGISWIVFFLVIPLTVVYGLDFSGYIQNYQAVIIEDGDFDLIENSFLLTIEKKSDRVALFSKPNLYEGADQNLNLKLREIYMDIYFESFDIRLGKQQIIWGKSDGVFITDQVSPKDFTNFILRDFDEIRIGVNSIKVDYYFGSNTLELVWIPVFTPNIIPPQDSIWNPTGFDFEQVNFEEIPKSLDNSESFLRFSHLGQNLDYELVSGYFWNDEPVLWTEYSTDILNPIDFFGEYYRTFIAGGSMGTSIGNFVFRSELIYYHPLKFQVKSEGSPLIQTIESDMVKYLIGIEKDLFGFKTGLQFTQSIISDYNDEFLERKYEEMLTFNAKNDFLRDTLHLELFSYYGMNDKDGLVRLKLSYDISDNLIVLLGSDVFFGTTGDFGQFDDNDLAYFKVKYLF